MDIHPTLSTRFIQAAGQALRALLWLMAGVWALVAVSWVLLQFWIVPRIDEIRPHLERQATRALGVPVSIGAVRLHQSGVMPSFELTDIVLRDAASRPALHLSSVVGTVSPRSLFWLGFEQLVIDSPDLDIRRGRDGVVRVAGLDFSHGEGSDGQAADWFFSQPEFVIRHGRVQWADDYQGRPAVALADVSVVARNRGRRHDVRIDASPPTGWGERFTVTGRFRQPLLVGRSGDWMNWSGTLYARFSHVDVRQLHQQVSLDLEVKNAAGGLQAWVDWERGMVSGTTLDLALSQFQGRLATDMAMLDLRQVRGRLDMRRLAGGLELVTRGLTFDTPDGGHWPGGDVRFEYVGGEGSLPGRGRLVTGVIDVDVLAGLVLKLPVGLPVHDALRRHAPAGRLEHLDASWETRGVALTRFSARGRATDVSLQAVPAPVADEGVGPIALGMPGLSRASVDFDVTERGGRLQLGLNAGAIVLPGVWEAPAVRLDRLNADVQWEVRDAREGPALSVRIRRLQWANPDMAGELSGQWRTSRAGEAASGQRYPGVVDVSGRLQRGDLSQLHRYLPLAVLPQARQYVRESMVAGQVKSATFRVKGAVMAFPFANNHNDGEFTLLAQVVNGRYDYAPEMVRPAGSAPWPALEGVSAEVAMDRAALEVRKARGGFVGWPALQWSQSRARVPDLLHQPVLDAQLEVRGPLSDALGWVNASPVNTLLHGVLQPMSATGPLDLRLKLHVPVHQLAQSRVQGTLVFGGNDLDVGPAVPVLGNVQGTLAFTEADLGFSGAKATVVGGETRLDGSLSRTHDSPGVLVVRAQGVASAEGLRASERLGWVSRLALFAQGQTAYQLQLRMLDGYPELDVRLPLEGMAVGLPMPLAKPAATAFPVRLSTRLVTGATLGTASGATTAGAASAATSLALSDRLAVELGSLGQLEWERDIRPGGAPRVVRGSMAVGLVGNEAAPMPDSGVLGNVRLDVLDLDAWQGVARRLLPAAAGRPSAAPAQEGGGSSGAAVLDAYLPTILGLRANEVRGGGRVLREVVLGGSRTGSVWRATVDARELNGYVEADLGGGDGARLLARLSRLQVPRSLVGDVQQLLEQAPDVLPALDIVADAFEWNGRALGRLELEGSRVLTPLSRMRAPSQAWALHRFVLSVPEATVQASGRWRPAGPLAALTAGAARQGDMELDVQSDITDVGALLHRLGMDNLVRAGKGRVQGRLGWSGSPLSPDYPSMRGHLALDLQAGQFLRADPGVARLLGILSLQSLPRRLALDFRDVFNEGFRFDTARGQADIKDGIAHFDGLRIKGIAAAVAVEGSADLVRETQQLHVVVVPDLNAGTASLLTALVNPVMGLSTLLAQTLLSQPLSQAASQELVVDGTWSEPRVTRVERPASVSVPPLAPADSDLVVTEGVMR